MTIPNLVPTTLRKRILIALTIFLAGLAWMAGRAWLPSLVFNVDPASILPYLVELDDELYSLMAHGRVSEARSPCTKRMLFPWLAHTVSSTSGISVPMACMILNTLAWGALAWFVTSFFSDFVGKPWLAAVALLTPIPLESLLRGYMPDLFHAALLSAFFYVLMRGRQRWALALMFAAFLTRESTLLLCVCAAGVAWWNGQKLLFRGSLVVLLAGVLAGSWFALLGCQTFTTCLTPFTWRSRCLLISSAIFLA